MQVVVLLYEAMTVLDAIGPSEVLGQMPGSELRFAARRAGEIRSDTRALGLVADHALDQVDSADVLIVPGGPGDEWVRKDQTTLDWIARIHETTQFTTSVCTGSLILGAAGLLDGCQATTHWMRREALREYGAEPVVARYVQSGRIITAAGVSAGIDMALEVVRQTAGDDAAQTMQLAIEYDPAPPFDAGSPEKAPGGIVDGLRVGFEALMQSRLDAAAQE